VQLPGILTLVSAPENEMIPLRDTVRSRSLPWMTWCLIALNLLIFLYESVLPASQFDLFISVFGLVPARLSLSSVQLFPWLTLITSMFLHGSWFHVIGNMWFLFIFGDNVEDRMGPARFLVFYLAAGITAGLCQFLLSPSSAVPTVGASGAIAGVLGAYFLLYPRARVITLIFLFVFPWLVEIPALIYLGIWFLMQLSSGLLHLGQLGANVGGIAWWAHIGGFAFGLLTVRLFAMGRRYATWHADEYGPW
jgi:membrane associated rhomboid family serine protease